MSRHAEDRRESARGLGFAPYVSELAYRPNRFDDRAGELSAGDREDYAKAHGRDWPKPDRHTDDAMAAEQEHMALSADADRDREAEALVDQAISEGWEVPW